MSEIIENKLFLSGINDILYNDTLEKHGITDVISVISGVDLEPLEKRLSDMNINHHLFTICDSECESISTIFTPIFEIIDSSPTSIIHCALGVSRSAAVAVAYMMYKKRMNLKDAVIYVAMRRPSIYPNDGFVYRLIDYEYKLFGMNTFSHNEEGLFEFRRTVRWIRNSKDIES